MAGGIAPTILNKVVLRHKHRLDELFSLLQSPQSLAYGPGGGV